MRAMNDIRRLFLLSLATFLCHQQVFRSERRSIGIRGVGNGGEAKAVLEYGGETDEGHAFKLSYYKLVLVII